MYSCTTWLSEIELAAEPISASRSRRFVRHVLAEHELSHLTDDVELVVSELATNAMAHAPTSFKVTLQVVEPMLLLAVENDYHTEAVSVASRRLDAERRAVAIVQLLSHDCGVDVLANGRRSVWAAFDLR